MKSTSEDTGLRELRRARATGRGLFASVFLFSIFVNALMLTGPLYMLQVYDRVLGSRSEETLVALSLLVALLYVLMGMLDYARGRMLARVGARFQSTLDSNVFDAVLRIERSVPTKGQSATGLRDLETIQGLFSSPVLLAVFDIPWTPLFFAAIFIFHPWLGWLAMGGGAVLIVLATINQLLTRKKTAQAMQASARAHAFAEEARKSAEIVQAQGMQSSMETQWTQLRTSALGETINASDWTGTFTAITKSFRLFLQSAMLGLGAYLTLQGEITAGAMIAGSIILGRALAPVEQTLSQWQFIQRAMASWQSLSKVLSMTMTDRTYTDLPVPAAIIDLKGVTVVPPGSKTPTLRGVSFRLEPGHALGIIGNSGSGKSTLARALLGLAPPVSGELRFGGATLDQYEPEKLASHIGYLPQTVTLFTGSVAQNIARMSPNPDGSAVVKAAKNANAHEMILSLPEGYDTIIREDSGKLSGGQKQRIGLARALYGDPALLVLDEPNSALDSEGSEALNRTVREFKSNEKAVVIMTHRPMAISECDQLVVLDNGQVRAFGPRDEVLKSMIKNADTVTQAISSGSNK